MCKLREGMEGPFLSSWLCDDSGYPVNGNTGLCSWGSVTCDLDGYVVSIYQYGKQITGTLSTYIGQVTTLTTLVLDKNQLVGTLPTEIGLLTRVTELALAANAFTGTFIATLLTLLPNFVKCRYDSHRVWESGEYCSGHRAVREPAYWTLTH